MRVQPGVINLDVTKRIAALGYYYAPDPSSQTVCTIGGNVAENSGGAHCLKYGFTVHHVVAVTLVTGSGEIAGGDGDFRVQVGRRRDVHDVNQRRLHDLAPVGRGELPAKLCPRGLHAGGVAPADRVQLDVRLEVEEARCLPPRV